MRGLVALICDAALLLAAYTVVAASTSALLTIPALLFSAVQLHRLALLGHEGAHGLLTGRTRSNDVLTNLLCLYPFGVTVAGYRHWHFDHHRLVGTARDPELLFKFGPKYTPPMPRLAFARMFAADLIGAGVPELLRLCHCCRPRSARDAAGLAAYWLLVGCFVISFDLWWVLIAHGLAICTGFWALFRIRGWTEHVGAAAPEATHRFRAPLLLRYSVFPHSTDMHWEHHRFPGVPAYKLAAVRARIPEPRVLGFGELITTFADEQRSPLPDDGHA